MKRILVDKNEPIAELIERIIEDPEVGIVLVVPKGSNLSSSVSNFHLLSREAKAAGKTITIESVDESVLALAKSSRIEAIHPLLDAPTGSPLSDIVPRTRAGEQRLPAAAPPKERSTPRRPSKPKEMPHEDSAARAEPTLKVSPFSSRTEVGSEEDQLLLEDQPHRFRLRLNWKFFTALVAFLLLIGGGFLVVNRFFGKATVAIVFNKTPWSYSRGLVADISASSLDSAKGILPGALFTMQKNTTELLPASGRKNVAQKATGKIVIYNAYSSSPQALVATTRFQTPDGKIFRLVSGVTVPGAQIQNGNIIPSQITADIIADKAGPDYNVGPIAKLAVPGFAGSPKYAGFYGAIPGVTSSGFIGERAVPTDADIAAGKDTTTKLLKAALQSSFTSSYPPGIVVPSGASQIAVTRLNVNTNTDDQGKFSIFGEANMTAIGFKESDVKNILLSVAHQDHPDTVFQELSLTYANAAPDFTKKKMTFALSASGTLWAAFSPDEFAKNIVGKNLGEARSLVSALPGLTTAKISLWPVWLGSIPNDLKKITVTTE